jgi:flagellar basal body rod protein FlgG
MEPGVYSAGSSLVANLRAQEVTAHNLANINTPGFRRRLALFHPFQAQLAAAQPSGTQVDEVVIDFAPGPVQQTGNPLDVALEGEGFFVLRGPSGYLYSRKGNFALGADGTVVDSVGRPLLAEGGGELKIPNETREIRVDSRGQVFADKTSVGRIWVADVPKPRAFVPAAYTAFTLPAGAPPATTVENPTVVQGALEGSNTNAVDEVVSMIVTLRSFEAAQRVLHAIDESLKQTTSAASAPNS